MKVAELTIGSWVKHNGKRKKVAVIWGNKVSLIDPDQTYGSIYADKYPIEDIEPIPLTKEIVLKNFEVNEYVMKIQKEKLRVEDPEWLHLTYKNVHYEWVFTWEMSLFHDGFSLFIFDCPMPELHYVHELQQFLRLCDIKEEVKL